MTSYLPDMITRPIANSSDFVKSTLGGLTWGPAVTLSKTVVSGMFSKLEKGTLIVKDNTTGETDAYGEHLPAEMIKFPNGSTNGYTNGTTNGHTNGVNGTKKKSAQNPKPAPQKITLTIYKDSFWVRVFLFADMGFAEAYMLGEVDTNHLAGFFQVGFPFAFHTTHELTPSSCSSPTAKPSATPTP